MNIESLTKIYERTLLLAFALTPVLGIWYLVSFATPLRFEHHGFHEVAIGVATLVGGFVAFVAWRSYLHSGEVFLRWLTVGILAFTLIYAPHGLLTRTAHHNIWLFLLYGPVSRLAMLACMVYGLAQYGKSAEDPAAMTRSGFWWRVVWACLAVNVVVAVLAFSPLADSVWVRMPMELGAIGLCLLAIGLMLWRRISSPLMLYYALALAFFAQAAIGFILARPWNHLWWLAHVIFAGGFFVLSWGIARALLTTRSFALAFSEEQMTRELRDLHAAREATLNAIPDLLLEVDKHGRVLGYHARRDDLLAAPPEVFMGKTLADVLPASANEVCMAAIKTAAIEGYATGAIYSLSLDNAETWFELSASSVPKIEGKEQRFILLARDITARRAAEIELEVSLREKTVLLNEVHHRVKNNLQVVSSLLRLESARSGQDETRLLLKSMQSRIQAMALLHETLYRAGTFAAVDLGAYLKQLAAQAFRTLQTPEGGVRLEVDVTAVQVSMDQATPCGLLVNELISNALKHGFPDGRAGEVRIALHRVGTDEKAGGPVRRCEVRLCVSNTGVGLPPDFAQKRQSSLGLQLVTSLSRQLGGELVVGPGATFSLVFAVADPDLKREFI